MAMDFTTPITNRAEAEQFLRDLVASDMQFHLEDDPADVINGPTGEPLFTADEVPHVNARVNELYSLDWSDCECPIGFMLDIENPGWRDA